MEEDVKRQKEPSRRIFECARVRGMFIALTLPLHLKKWLDLIPHGSPSLSIPACAINKCR